MNKQSKFIFTSTIILIVIVLAGGFYFFKFKNDTRAGTWDIVTANEPKIKDKNLSSFFTNKSDYDFAFSNALNIEKKNVLAGIVSHHFLAKDLIARFFSGIENKDIDNIILIGPDHFNMLAGSKADAATTKLFWDTPYGQLDSNKEIQNKLLASNNIVENDSVFKSEHSIYILAPFIKKAFPEAKIIPLIVRGSSDYEKFIGIGNNIKNIAGDRTLLIVSSDFSHDVSSGEAEKNDLASIQSLKNLNEKNIDTVNSDCKACMAVLQGYVKDSQNKFYLNENKNSSDFGSQDKTVTSYVSGYYLRDNNDINILFLGDMMFDRNIRLAINKNSGEFIFQKVENLFQNNDLVVGNLEGPITDYRSVSVNSRMGSANNFTFTFDPSVAGLLAGENIKLVNLGNNHILNFGTSGVAKTRKYLAESGIDFFGDPEKGSIVENINGFKIAFVSYNQFFTDGDKKAFQNLEDVKKNNPDLIILYAHWGAEYMTKPGTSMKVLAHKFIDSGVDLVIGSHPHVVQSKEEYKGKLIYYSLGNFIFDQYFSANTEKGLAVKVEIDPIDKKISAEEYPVRMEKSGQTVLNGPINSE